VPPITIKEIADMSKTSLATPIVAGLLLAGGAAYASSPQYLYGAFTNTYGTSAAVATTTGTEFDNRSGYVVAAIVDSAGGLEVKAWQDTTHDLSEVGHVHADSNTINAVAAAGLDSSHVITADVDVNGVVSLRTWTLGGTGGIAELNHYHSPVNSANPLAGTPALGMVALSATEIVTAYQDELQNLTLQAWTVSDTSAAPQPAGTAATGGAVTQIAIATIDSTTVMTAVVAPDSDEKAGSDLKVSTWGVDSTGVHLQNQKVLKNVVGGLYPSVSIGATTVETVNYSQLPPFKFTRRAFTPIVNADNVIEVIDWQISSSGEISMVGKPSVGGSEDFAFAVAGCMLQTGIPMTVYADLGGPGPADNQDVTVGWFEAGYLTWFTEISGQSTGVSYVTATPAGNDFDVLVPRPEVNAYFVTGALTSGGFLPPSATNTGQFKIQVWSYPIVLPLW
jgi:hypothetical protein